MSSQYLQIKSTTSNRDSHGLFDYESSQVTKDSLKVTSSGSLQIKGNLISKTESFKSPIDIKNLASGTYFVKILLVVGGDSFHSFHMAKYRPTSISLIALKSFSSIFSLPNKNQQDYYSSYEENFKRNQTKIFIFL